ncbi:Putative conjugal transfer nickase/helicase TraI C-term [Variovorax sp. HW608]|nr:Putative conjugal transfer nickase/helicase TraI C-term [Variovorax sp. HW608]
MHGSEQLARPNDAEMIRAPTLNKPRPAAKPGASSASARPGPSLEKPARPLKVADASQPPIPKRPMFDDEEADYLLDASEMASDAAMQPPRRKRAQAMPVPAARVEAPAKSPTPGPAAPTPARTAARMLAPMDLMNVGRGAVAASTTDSSRKAERSSLVAGQKPESDALSKPVGGPRPMLMSGPAPEVAARANVGRASPDHEDSEGAAARADLPPVILQHKLPEIPGRDESRPQPGPLALDFMRWLQQSLASRELKYNETGAVVHFVPEGMALVSPLIFKMFAATLVAEAEVPDQANRIQREVVKAGWHMTGPNRTNVVRYSVIGRGHTVVSRLAAVVLVEPGRWVQPVPPSNPVLKLK